MITYCKGDLLQADTEALVNAINCIGVMGKGIALQFKKKYMNNFVKYADACSKGIVQTGKMFTTKIGDGQKNPKYIINFPTKQHWRNDSKIEYISGGLDALVEEIQKLEIKSIAIPALGCSNGNLQWSVVNCLLVEKLSGLEGVSINLYEPQ